METNEKRSARSILREKCLDALERTELPEIFMKASAVAGTVALTVSLAYPHETAVAVLRLASFDNWIIPKAVGSWLFCSNFRRLASSITEMLREDETPRQAVAVPVAWRDTLEGIPTAELISLLFETGRLSTADAKRFSVPPARWSALLSKLEEVNIMVRWDKNARVLNPGFSRSDVVYVLAGCAKAEDVKLRVSPTLQHMEKEMTNPEEPLVQAEKLEENSE